MDAWRSLGVVRAGLSDVVRGYHIRIPRQAQIMLIASTRGRGYAREGGVRFTLTPRTLLINPPCAPVEFGIAGEDWQMVWWYLRPGPSWTSLLAGGTRLQPFAHGRLLAELQEALIQRLARAETEIARQIGATIAAHLCELASLAPAADDPLGRLWAEVEDRLHEPWPVATLAARLRCSIPTLQRRLHRRFGRSAGKLLVESRMRRALELLERTEHPLRVIATQVGYSDPFTLSAAMRRHYGRSPQALRARRERP